MPSSRRLRLTADIIQIAFPIALGIGIALTAVNVPFWDEWEWAELIFKLHQGTLHFADLWSQHNEHRLLFPQFIMLGLDSIGGWSPVREQYVSLALLVCGQIGLGVIIRRTVHRQSSSIATILATVIYYGLWQTENLTWGFQMAWFLCDTACIVVVVFLTRRKRRLPDLLTALLLGIVASFSSSQGLFVWVAGAVAIVIAQRRVGSTLAIWLVAAALTYATYVHGLRPSTGGHFDIIRNPVAALRYVVTYLGSPIAGWSGPTLSSAAGLTLLCALAVSAVRDLRQPLVRRHLLQRGPWYALSVFPLAAAVATASGRAGYGEMQALSSRYTSISGLAWVALVCIGATYHPKQHLTLEIRSREKTFIVVSAVVFAAFIIRSDLGGGGLWHRTAATLASARYELEHNDPAALAKLYPHDDRIEMLIEELRRVRDGPFLNG